jgi:hypothetical protein
LRGLVARCAGARVDKQLGWQVRQHLRGFQTPLGLQAAAHLQTSEQRCTRAFVKKSAREDATTSEARIKETCGRVEQLEDSVRAVHALLERHSALVDRNTALVERKVRERRTHSGSVTAVQHGAELSGETSPHVRVIHGAEHTGEASPHVRVIL